MLISQSLIVKHQAAFVASYYVGVPPMIVSTILCHELPGTIKACELWCLLDLNLIKSHPLCFPIGELQLELRPNNFNCNKLSIRAWSLSFVTYVWRLLWLDRFPVRFCLSR